MTCLLGTKRVGTEGCEDGNQLSDFPSPEFTIHLFCDACGHQANLDREKVPENVSVQELTQRLSGTFLGSRESSIRIIYTGAGGFRHS